MNDTNVNIICPFYVCEGRTTITCEWMQSQRVRMEFGDQNKKKTHKICNCEKYKSDCIIRKTINEQYEECQS